MIFKDSLYTSDVIVGFKTNIEKENFLKWYWKKYLKDDPFCTPFSKFLSRKINQGIDFTYTLTKSKFRDIESEFDIELNKEFDFVKNYRRKKINNLKK